MSTTFRLALAQIHVSDLKEDNIARAVKVVAEAAAKGANIVAFSECFNGPVGPNYFVLFAEEIPSGPTSNALAEAAKSNGVYVLGGFAEKEGENVYNSCVVFNPSGELIGKHRKVHLFDINIPGKTVVQESAMVAPGNKLTMFETPWCKIGLGICYDLRFTEMSQIYARNGCKLLLFPSAFGMTTGPAHWELMLRARALDNQVFVAGVSSARNEKFKYVVWGHSLVASPFGKVMASTGYEEDVLYTDIDMSAVDEVRSQIPILKQRREDIYTNVESKHVLNSHKF